MKSNYTIIRHEVLGAVVKNGETKIIQYEYICNNHKGIKTVMKQEVYNNKEVGFIELYAKCPTCDLTILEGIYKDEEVL